MQSWSIVGAMPLSDREKELLAEMERALSADDPRLVSTLTGNPRAPQKKRALLGLTLVGLGLVLLLAGLISQTIPLGIAGFLVALGGVVLAISNAPKIGGEFPTKTRKRATGALDLKSVGIDVTTKCK